MKCFFCECDMTEELTTYFTEVNERIIIVKNVPCTKCGRCGEVAYNGCVSLQLEKIVDSMEKVQTEIAVLSYYAEAV